MVFGGYTCSLAAFAPVPTSQASYEEVGDDVVPTWLREPVAHVTCHFGLTNVEHLRKN